MKKLYFLLTTLLITVTLSAQLTGDGSAGTPYQINTASDLVYLSETSSLWSGNQYFKLMSDIDMTGVSITPIGFNNADGTLLSPFTGEFDGNSKTISNLTVSPGSGYGLNAGFGLFGSANGTIKDLGLVNPTIEGAGLNRVSAFVGQPTGASLLITGCFVDGGTIDCNGWAGSFVGGTWGTIVLTDCWSSSSIASGWGSAGLVGFLQGGDATFTNVAFYGSSNGNKPITRTNGSSTETYSGVFYDATGSLDDDQTGDEAVGLTTLDNLALYVGFDGADWEIDPNYNFAILSGFLGHSTDLESEIVTAPKVTVFLSGNTLYVTDAEASTYKLYNLSGVLVTEGEVAGSSVVLDAPKGLYIVKVGTTTKKVMIK